MAASRSRSAGRLPARAPLPRRLPARQSKLAEGLGLVAGVAALAAGGIAAGLELERRVVSKRIYREQGDEGEEFFTLRSDGPTVLTPDGVMIHTEVEEADPSDPDFVDDSMTLVFVHGYALSQDCWHFQRRHYRGAVRMVFYDQRSHGRSGRSAPERCRVPQLAEDLSQILEEVVGVGPVILIGHSMGSMTIMRLAQQHPEWFGDRVRGVALLSTSAGEMADHSPIKGVPGRAFSRIAQPMLATLNRVPELVEKSRKAGSDIAYVVTRRMSFGSDVPPSYVEFMSQMLGDTPLEVVGDFYPAIRELDEFVAFEVLSHVETAVVGGLDDVITPIRYTDRIIEHLPGAESLRLPDCGHMGIIEHHDEFNEVLDHLIQRVRRHVDD
jgi:pimeloyl-ACP methyl ester carboxylesterase